MAGIASAYGKKDGGFYISGSFYSEKNGKTLDYQSSYELHTFEILEQMKVVKCYDRCTFYVEYECAGKIHLYNPDIMVTYQDGSKEIIEVKPLYQVTDDINVAKFKSLEEYCKENGMSWKVWTEKDIFARA